MLLPASTAYFVSPNPVGAVGLNLGTQRYPFGRPSGAMLSPSISQFPFTAALLLFIGGRRLEAKSVIVDDSDTRRITYSEGWIAYCVACDSNLTQPFNGTWHYRIASELSFPFFIFEFTGTSIEARYVAIDDPGTLFPVASVTNANYSIDGNHLGTTVRTPTYQGDYAFNQSLFSIDGLSNTEHTLRVDLLEYSVLQLDYLVYDDGSAVASATATSTSSSPSYSSFNSLILGPSVSSTVNDECSTYGPSVSPTMSDASSIPNTINTNIGAIVGGVVSAIALVLGVVLLWYFKYHSQETSQRRTPPIQPYDPTGSGAHPDLRMATVPGTLPSRFYGSSGTVGQVDHKSQQTGLTPVPQQAVSSHKPVYPTPGRLPSSFHRNVDEPVEAGLMSREISTRVALAHYGPGGVQRDDGAPPQPGQ